MLINMITLPSGTTTFIACYFKTTSCKCPNLIVSSYATHQTGLGFYVHDRQGICGLFHLLRTSKMQLRTSSLGCCGLKGNYVDIFLEVMGLKILGHYYQVFHFASRDVIETHDVELCRLGFQSFLRISRFTYHQHPLLIINGH